MTTALKAFKRIQISAPEVTPGTAVEAKEVFLATMSAPYTDLTKYFPEDDRNLLSKNRANEFAVSQMVELSMEGAINHRHAVWMFCNAIRGNITPTQPDNINEPNAYLWDIEPGLTTANTPDIANGIDTFTIEYGDNIQDYEAPYMFTRSLEITGAPDEPVMFTWETTAASVTSTTLTPALSVQTVQYFPANTVSFYVDTSYATIGNTVKTDFLKAWTWTLETMFTPRFTASGDLSYKGINEDSKSVALELSYKRGDLSEVERALWEASSTTYLRIKCLGEEELDASQGNLPYITLDGAFRYTEWPESEDEDGTLITTVTAESVYDATASKEYEVGVYTDLSAYP